MRWSRAFVAAGLCAGLPAAAAGQGRSCEIVKMENFRQEVVGGEEVVYIQGPVDLLCDGGVRIRADDAVNYQTRRELRLTWNVFYSDPEKSIEADWIHRFGADGRLMAGGNVIVREHDSGAVIRGTTLTHEQPDPAEPARTVVTGRPHAVLPPRTSGQPDPAGDTLHIDADRMEALGREVYDAYGNVGFRRGETSGSAQQGHFDQAGESVRLVGMARMWGDRFELKGDTVLADVAGGELRDVTALGSAALTSEDLNMTAPALRIFLREGELERLAARGGPADRARATAREFLLVADSIEAVAPAERLERVTAVGGAHGRRTADSVDISLPELIRHDWLEGDTIIGYFAAADSGAGEAAAADPLPGRPAADSAEAEPVLERLVAIGAGSLARSVFRMAPDSAKAAPPAGTPAELAVNYFVAERITLSFLNGEVNRVDAVGQIRGLHLQPLRQAPPQPAVTAAAPPPEGGGRRP